MISSSSKNLFYFWIAAIFVLTFFAYSPAMEAGFIWDDDDYVTNNQTLRSWEGLQKIWTERGAVPQYYPMVHSTYWVEYQLWDLNPKGYHFVNILLHALNAILIGLILRKLHFPGFIWVAIIFAIHPVHVESVAWITERKNVLSGLFYLSSFLAYIKCFPTAFMNNNVGGTSGSFFKVIRLNQSNWLYYFVSLLLFACALLSKTVTSTLPAAILLLIWWKKGKISLRNVMSVLPFFLLGFMFSINTIWMKKNHVGAQGLEWTYSFLERCLIAGRALWFYTGKFLYPVNLTFIYPRWKINSEIFWQYLFPVAVLIVMLILWKMRNRARGPLVAVCFFGGTLMPALGFINYYPMRYSFVADHFQYLASLGLISLGVAVFVKLKKPTKPEVRKVFWSILKGGLILLLVSLTWQQAHIYRNVKSLWIDTVAKNPNTWLGHNNLGKYFESIEKHDEAISHYSEALKIKPNEAKTHYNLGNVYTKYNKLDLAIFEYKKAIFLKPNYAEAYYNLGIALGEKGLHEQANQVMRQGMSLSAGKQSQ